jgi:hypothetical protein
VQDTVSAGPVVCAGYSQCRACGVCRIQSVQGLCCVQDIAV